MAVRLSIALVFFVEVVDSVAGVFGVNRVGVRLSPYGTFNDMGDSHPVELFTYVLDQLSKRGIAYVHVIEPRATAAGGGGAGDEHAPNTTEIFRKLFKGIFIFTGGYKFKDAKHAVETNQVDAVAFGWNFIANPDLPERFKMNAPLNVYDRSTFYGGGSVGYTDYPAMQDRR